MNDICKNCKKSLTKHFIRGWNNCPMGYKDSDESDLFSGVNVFSPMDNLDYVEWLAKERNLV